MPSLFAQAFKKVLNENIYGGIAKRYELKRGRGGYLYIIDNTIKNFNEKVIAVKQPYEAEEAQETVDRLNREHEKEMSSFMANLKQETQSYNDSLKQKKPNNQK